MLTFPADKSDFSAPNGVTYAWDGTDGKWRVKAFRSIDDFIVQLQDQAPAADESKVGDLWFDTSDESLTLFVYTGGEWIPAAPPVSLDGINATIDAALIVQNDLLARVEAGEVVQTGVLDNITTLQHKVEALEGTVIDGKWYAESRSNPREGGFDITSGGLQSMGDWSADFLRVHKTDSTGKAFTFAEVSTGDYIRIGAPGSTAVYKVNEVVSGSLDWQTFGVELANFTGTPIPDLTYDFEFLPSFDPSAYATVQYVDAQDDLNVKLAGENIITPSWRVKSQNKSFITINTNEMKLYNIADPTNHEDHWAANKGYVDTQIANIDIPDMPDLSGYLTKNGTQILDSTKWRLQQPDSDSTNRNFIEIENNNMKLFHVQDPTDGSAEWAANKGYVDQRVKKVGDVMSGRLDVQMDTETSAAIRTVGTINVKASGEALGGANNFVAHKDYVRVWSTPSDPKDVATKAYVDENAGGPPVPARWAWKFKGETSDSRRNNLAAGEFIGPVIGSSSGSYSPYYYFHLKPNNSSYRMYQRTYDEELVFNTPDGAPLISIWYVGGSTAGDYLDGKVVHMSSQRVKRYKIHKDGANAEDGPYFQVECHNGSQYGNHFYSSSLAVDRIYYATLAGIF